MKKSQSIQNRLIFSVFGSVFIFTASLLIFYEYKLHQLSISKSSQVMELIGSRYHNNISNYLVDCHQYFENLKFKADLRESRSIILNLNALMEETQCYQQTGIYFEDSEIWLSSRDSVISKDQIKNLINKPQSSYWWNKTKSYLIVRDISLSEDAKLIFLMNLEFIRTQLNKYQNDLKKYGFNEPAVFIKNSETFQGFGIKESYYNKLQARNSELNFQLEGGDFISISSIPMPREVGPGFLCSIIPSYDVFRSIYNTGYLTIFSALTLLIISILFVLYVVQLTIKPLKIAITQIEKSATDIDQVSDQNLTVGQELSQMVHQQSDVIRQLLNYVEESIRLGSINSRQLNDSKALLVNSIKSIQSSFSSLGNISTQLNTLQNISDDMKIELNSLCEISNRMDVVSINASIEAARVGPRGRNFAAIAEEISKLLTSSLERSSKIEEQLNSLIKHLGETIYLSNESQNLLGISQHCTYETSEVLGFIASQANQQISQLNTLVKILNSNDRQTIKNQQLAKHCAELGVLLKRSIDDLLQVSQLIASLVKK